MFGAIKVEHDFDADLALSHAIESLPVWEEVYKRAFPTMVSMVSYPEDGFWQREGIDRGIILSNTKQIFIDEKVRRRNESTGKVYDDIALEYVSNDQTYAPGWVVKPLRADYIAYLIAPLGACYLLPVIQLQQAWRENAGAWRNSFKTIEAQNKGYKTLSCCVPVSELFPAIGRCLRVSFQAFEVED